MKHNGNKNHLNLKTAVAEAVQGKAYTQITDVKQTLKKAGIPSQAESVKKYLYELVKSGRLFSAGRGWYSNIAKAFVLDTQPLQKLITQLRGQFPLLTFSCWSMAQLQSYFHHLQSKTVMFVYVEKDAMGPVYDYLRQHYDNCYFNPQKREVQKTFRVHENAIIVRPAISEEPRKGYHATIEKILVDLFIERTRLELFDEWEYQQLFEKIVMHYRVDMAGLIRYAGRRKVKREILDLIH